MIRAYNGYDTRAASDAAALSGFGPSKTVQSQREEADINTIVRNFGVTGQLPANVRVPSYGDFTGVDDYRTALHALREAEASFMQMPADVRVKFDNDAGKFVDFCSDTRNLDEMRKLGLAVPAPASDAPAP